MLGLQNKHRPQRLRADLNIGLGTIVTAIIQFKHELVFYRNATAAG